MANIASFAFLTTQPSDIVRPIPCTGDATSSCQRVSTSRPSSPDIASSLTAYSAGIAALAAASVAGRKAAQKRARGVSTLQRRAENPQGMSGLEMPPTGNAAEPGVRFTDDMGNELPTREYADVELEEEYEPPFVLTSQVGAWPAEFFVFDPLGLCKTKEDFFVIRVQELKHGRVAMIAAVGFVVQCFVEVDLDQKVTPLYGLTNAHGLGAVYRFYGTTGFASLWAFLFLIFYLEDQIADDKDQAGSFRDPAGLKKLVGEDNQPFVRTAELVNARFAMLSVLGMAVAELVTGRDAIQQFGFDLAVEPVAEIIEGAAGAVQAAAAAVAEAPAAVVEAPVEQFSRIGGLNRFGGG